MSKAVTLYRRIPVQEFIEQHQEMQTNPEWQAMLAGYQEVKQALLDEYGETHETTINDVYGKAILSHVYGESVAIKFKRWIDAYYPCEDDLLIALEQEKRKAQQRNDSESTARIQATIDAAPSAQEAETQG